MTERDAIPLPVYCPHCGAVLFRSGAWCVETRNGAAELWIGAAFVRARCARCGGESQSRPTLTKRLYLRPARTPAFRTSRRG